MEKRLFIGVKIHPKPVLQDFYSTLKKRLENEKIRWVDIENMHITLKYLGNTDINLIPRIREALKSIADKFEPFQLEIKGLGRFVKNKQTNVLWLGVNYSETLNKLAITVINEMQSFGFASENRPYKAHLTLGRLKSSSNEGGIGILEENFKGLHLQVSDVEEFMLYESVNIQGRLIYKILKEYCF